MVHNFNMTAPKSSRKKYEFTESLGTNTDIFFLHIKWHVHVYTHAHYFCAFMELIYAIGTMEWLYVRLSCLAFPNTDTLPCLL